MDAEDVSNEVRRYSILVGFLLIVVFVVPCVGFALFSKHCQKQTRKRRVSCYTCSACEIQQSNFQLMQYIVFNTPTLIKKEERRLFSVFKSLLHTMQLAYISDYV